MGSKPAPRHYLFCLGEHCPIILSTCWHSSTLSSFCSICFWKPQDLLNPKFLCSFEKWSGCEEFSKPFAFQKVQQKDFNKCFFCSTFRKLFYWIFFVSFFFLSFFLSFPFAAASSKWKVWSENNRTKSSSDSLLLQWTVRTNKCPMTANWFRQTFNSHIRASGSF